MKINKHKQPNCQVLSEAAPDTNHLIFEITAAKFSSTLDLVRHGHVNLMKMSKKVPLPDNGLQEVRVDVTRSKKHSEYDRKKAMAEDQRNDFVYVNPAYIGSMHSVNENPPGPPTSVIREQYWACSRWPYGQKILAGAVGLLVGAIIGLAVTVALRGSDSDNVIGGIFRTELAE